MMRIKSSEEEYIDMCIVGEPWAIISRKQCDTTECPMGGGGLFNLLALMITKNEIYGFDNPTCRYMYVRSKKGQSFGIGGNYMKIPVSYVKVP